LATSIDHPLLRRLPGTATASGSELLDRFLDFVAERNLELYPAQGKRFSPFSTAKMSS
jgi:hypothetical protein